MKHRSGIAAVVAATSALVLGTTACATSTRVGPVEFLRRAELERTPEPMHSSRLIGVNEDRVELEIWDSSGSAGGSTRVVWCLLSELPPEIEEELRAGRNPWKR